MPVAALTDESVAAPREYSAVYEVLRKDEKVAKVTINLTRQGDAMVMRGFTHDMQGLAELLKVYGEQSVSGTWRDGRFQPEKYDFLFSLIGYKSAWQAEYDWPAGVVTTRVKSDEYRLPLDGGAADALTLFLNTRAHLAAGHSQMEVAVIDEDEIKHHQYVVEISEPLDTELGCLETTRVKRIRKNDKRTSLAWYANKYDYIPVMLLHKKRKDNSLAMKLISLVFDGQEVQLPAACRVDQHVVASG